MSEEHPHNPECIQRIREMYDILNKSIMKFLKDKSIDLEVHRVTMEEAVRFHMIKQNKLNMKEKEQVIEVLFGKDESANELGFEVTTTENIYQIPVSEVTHDITHRDGIASIIDVWNDEPCYIIFCYNNMHSGCGRTFEESLKLNFV